MSDEKILVVDDDEEILELIRTTLEKEAMWITTLAESDKVIPALQASSFDLVLLDLMLEGQDGFEILRQIRRRWTTLPVLIISARSEEEKKAIGFELDADDYLAKPFSQVELIARVRRHIRRRKDYSSQAQILPEESLKAGNLTLDLKSCILYKNNQPITLPARLFKILKFFMEHPGQVLAAEQIYSHCWNDHYFDENTLRVYIGKVRKLIEDNPNKPRYLLTSIGLGYRFTEPVDHR